MTQDEKERCRELLLKAIGKSYGGAELVKSVRYFMHEPLRCPTEEDRRRARVMFGAMANDPGGREFVKNLLVYIHPELAHAVRAELHRGRGRG